jgi:hypothetical protein
LQSCSVSVSLRKHWRGECPHDGNDGDQESSNISAQCVSARFRAFDDPGLYLIRIFVPTTKEFESSSTLIL